MTPSFCDCCTTTLPYHVCVVWRAEFNGFLPFYPFAQRGFEHNNGRIRPTYYRRIRVQRDDGLYREWTFSQLDNQFTTEGNHSPSVGSPSSSSWTFVSETQATTISGANTYTATLSLPFDTSTFLQSLDNNLRPRFNVNQFTGTEYEIFGEKFITNNYDTYTLKNDTSVVHVAGGDLSGGRFPLAEVSTNASLPTSGIAGDFYQRMSFFLAWYKYPRARRPSYCRLTGTRLNRFISLPESGTFLRQIGCTDALTVDDVTPPPDFSAEDILAYDATAPLSTGIGRIAFDSRQDTALYQPPSSMIVGFVPFGCCNPFA